MTVARPLDRTSAPANERVRPIQSPVTGVAGCPKPGGRLGCIVLAMPPPSGQPPKPPTPIELARQRFDPFDPRHGQLPHAPHAHGHAGGGCCGGHGAHAGQQTKRAGGGCCGGKDLGPMSKYEEPSPEDIERFSDVTRTCPECKGEVHDDAEICYHCGHVFGESSLSRVPPWVVGTACLAGLAILYWFAF